MNLNKYLAITLGDLEIDLTRSSEGSPVKLLGALRASGQQLLTLDQATIAGMTSDPAIAELIPEGISLTVNDILLADCNGTKVLAANLGANISLHDLPVIGDSLPVGANLAINSVQLLFASGALSQTDMTSVNAVVPTGISPLPTALRKGLNFAVAMTLGKVSFSVSSLPSNPSNGVATPPKLPSSASPKAVTVNKSIGPVQLSEIGLAFIGPNSAPGLSVDASIKIGPLTLGFSGLSVSLPSGSNVPEISLAGFSLEYSSDDVEIAGAFLDQANDYSGELTVSLSEVELSAIGSYATVNGSPSVFIYGLLEEPLGGPAFCFVEGLALAFGYNRSFTPPPVSGVANFALIAAASGASQVPATSSGLSTMLGNLDKSISPTLGEQFLGIGLKFTSFKVIDSFALLVVQFGNTLAFDVLGTSTYVAPSPQATDPVAQVELELVGSYLPDVGTLLIRGQLTPGSYVLSQACHLEGGFAIGNWFSGSDAGDFVYTFGGYAPNYTPPANYPQNVPQLGFLWQVDSDVSVKGGGYWAVTPKEVMLGGYLQTTYTSDWVHANFEIDADFLIDWSPFHYAAGFSVSFSLHVRVDLLFCSVWMGFEVSKSLQIWGPPFGGSVSIDLAVATVHIDFGADAAPAPLLSWTQFYAAHFPQPTKQASNPVVGINIEKGLIRKVQLEADPGTTVYVINPKDLIITTHTFVPASTLNGVAQNAFEAVPMGIVVDTNANQSNHLVTITGPSPTQLQTVARTANAPTAMWNEPSDTSGAARLTSLTFGATISPEPGSDLPTGVGPLSLAQLANEEFAGANTAWEAPVSFTGNSPTAANTLTPTAMDAGVYSTLQEVFDFSTTTAPAATGLQNRLKTIGANNIYTGTLNTQPA